MNRACTFIIWLVLAVILLMGSYPASPQEQAGGLQATPAGSVQTQPVPEPKRGLAESLQAWAPVTVLIGVFVTGIFTMVSGVRGARYAFASELLRYRLRQAEEFYAPAVIYVEQSQKVYRKLLWTIKRERADIPINGFRLLDHIYDFMQPDENKKDEKKTDNLKPLVKRILKTGTGLTALISEKSGLIEGGLTSTFTDYQAHFHILSAASDQGLTEAEKEGWHDLGYYPLRS